MESLDAVVFGTATQNSAGLSVAEFAEFVSQHIGSGPLRRSRAKKDVEAGSP